MKPERRQRLDDIGFVWDVLSYRWEEGFSKLTEFKEREGHCLVPKGFKLGEFNLAVWVVRQRLVKDNMSTERKEKLDAIGFVWDSMSHQWEEGFSKLLQFKEAKGHCKVPNRFKMDGFALGAWVSSQRQVVESMSIERKQKLNKLGFVWDPIGEAWAKAFSLLFQFKEAEGHCRVPRRFKTDGFGLGDWVANQRKAKDSMSPELKQRLDEIGFLWDDT